MVTSGSCNETAYRPASGRARDLIWPVRLRVGVLDEIDEQRGPIVYNPMPSRVRGDRIVLPVRQSSTFGHAGTRKVDAVTRHTKNSLGFR